MIIGPPRWEKPLTTDEQGRVPIPTPWAGRYVLEVVHFEEKAGGSGEENSIGLGIFRACRSHNEAA
jgi:hypothetical protein